MGQKNTDNAPSITNQLKRGQLNADQFEQLQVDKENINLSEEDKEKNEDEEDYSKLPPKKYLIHNPITGEVSEMKISQCCKMADCSKETSSPGLVKKPEVSKTSVRVRQPPGGVSSHIF